ncbi:hypothetical protein [Leadbetterella byssophila]|uniref:hypothetical protein n=1 Tax=Leadbetterella byssophila TaxID=316068 RepID=UPI0039A1A1D5
MSKGLPFILIAFFSYVGTFGQNVEGTLELQFNANNHVPFWMRANKFGSVPSKGTSSSFIGNIYKHYGDTSTFKKFDYGLGLEVRANIGSETNVTIIEGYGKVKYDFIEIRAGRFKEFLGLVDSSLSIGSFSISGNALGIPKIELRVPDYWPKNTLISGRGNYAHGWYGYIPSKGTLAQVDSLYTYFHQKSLWIRIARPHWKLKLYGGFVDNAYWGDEYKLHESFTLTKAQRYWSVISGKNWQDSKVGNHVGNIDIRAEYDLVNYKITTYRQFFYEVGALWHLANIADGLMGVTVQKKNPSNGSWDWGKLLLEFLYTKNQAGEPWSKPTPTGNENYLNHYLYNYGWSYHNYSLGTPFITPRHTAKEEMPYNELEYFVNNRLWALQAGFEGKAYSWDTRLKLSYSRNFGTRATESSFPVSNQFSFYLEGRKPLKNQFTAGFMLSADSGALLPNSTGLTLSLKKRF